MQVRVIAREVQYGGRGRLRAEVFDADDRWARAKILLHQVEEVTGGPFRQAEFTPPAAAVAPTPEPTPEPEIEPAPQTAEAVAEEAPAPARRQNYRTRALKADAE